MRERRDRLKTGLILIAFGVCLFCLLQNLGSVTQSIRHLSDILYPLWLGMALAFVFNVLMTVLEKLLGKIPPLKKAPKALRALSLVLTLLGAAGVIVLVILVIVPKLGEAVTLFTAALPESSQDLNTSLQRLLGQFGVPEATIQSIRAYIDGLTQQIIDLLRRSTGSIANYVLSTVVSALSSMMDLTFALIVAVYILADKERIGRFVKRCMQHFLPHERCDSITRLASLSFRTFSNFVRGQLLEAVILGFMCFLGMLIFRFPYAAVVSLLVGVTALIPIFGAWIGGAISAILVAAVDPVQGVMLIVYIVILQQIEGNLVYPRVVGSTIGLPGLLVMAAVIIGQGLMGVAGILIAVPLCAVGYTLLQQRLSRPAAAENAAKE